MAERMAVNFFVSESGTVAATGRIIAPRTESKQGPYIHPFFRRRVKEEGNLDMQSVFPPSLPIPLFRSAASGDLIRGLFSAR